MPNKRPNPIDEIAALALRSPGVAIVIALLAASFAGLVLHAHLVVGDLVLRGVAIVFACVALVSALAALLGFREERARRRPLPRSLQDVLRLSNAGFERLVADLFRRQGYRAEEVGGHGQGDGGIDLIMRKDDDPSVEHLVQCKKYGPDFRVTVGQVRDFIGAMAIRKTRCEGLIVTCGTFTDDAVATALGQPIRLIARDELLTMLDEANPMALAVSKFTARGASAGSSPPFCPKCGIQMNKIMARQGRHEGTPFWGCPNYPRCTKKYDAG